MWNLSEDQQPSSRAPFLEPQPTAKKQVAVPLQMNTTTFQPLTKPNTKSLAEIMRQESVTTRPPSRQGSRGLLPPPPPLSWSQRAAKAPQAQVDVGRSGPKVSLNLAAYLSNI
jgi:hypothetical protein